MGGGKGGEGRRGKGKEEKENPNRQIKTLTAVYLWKFLQKWLSEIQMGADCPSLKTPRTTEVFNPSYKTQGQPCYTTIY